MFFNFSAVREYIHKETSQDTEAQNDLFSQLRIAEENEIIEDEGEDEVEGDFITGLSNAVSKASQNALSTRTLQEYKRYEKSEREKRTKKNVSKTLEILID